MMMMMETPKTKIQKPPDLTTASITTPATTTTAGSDRRHNPSTTSTSRRHNPLSLNKNITRNRFESSNSQDDQRVMTTSGIERSDQAGTIGVSTGEITNLTLTENVLLDIENQIESTATSMENPDNDSSNQPPMATLIATTPHTALLHDYPNPKIATFFVGVYPTFTGLVSLKFIAKKYSPFDTHIPFLIISIVPYVMAFLDLAILFWLYERLKRPSNQHISPGHYKILTYFFYILLILAILTVVPLLFTRQR